MRRFFEVFGITMALLGMLGMAVGSYNLCEFQPGLLDCLVAPVVGGSCYFLGLLVIGLARYGFTPKGRGYL